MLADNDYFDDPNHKYSHHGEWVLHDLDIVNGPELAKVLSQVFLPRLP